MLFYISQLWLLHNIIVIFLNACLNITINLQPWNCIFISCNFIFSAQFNFISHDVTLYLAIMTFTNFPFYIAQWLYILLWNWLCTLTLYLAIFNPHNFYFICPNVTLPFAIMTLNLRIYILQMCFYILQIFFPHNFNFTMWLYIL